MSTAYPDLPAAMVGWLRSSPGVVSAVGEHVGALKIWAEAAPRGVELPWVVYQERDAELQYMTQTAGLVSVLESGTIRLFVVAAGKKQARDLARTIRRALDDAPLLFADGQLMHLRGRESHFASARDIAPDHPTAHAATIDFAFMVSRTG